VRPIWVMHALRYVNVYSASPALETGLEDLGDTADVMIFPLFVRVKRISPTLTVRRSIGSGSHAYEKNGASIL